MSWLQSNWVWLIVIAFFVAMHMFGHGHGHGRGRERHKHGREPDQEDVKGSWSRFISPAAEPYPTDVK